MRIQYTIIPIPERIDKICCKCATNLSVKYLYNGEYYCNVCMLKTISQQTKGEIIKN